MQLIIRDLIYRSPLYRLATKSIKLSLVIAIQQQKFTIKFYSKRKNLRTNKHSSKSKNKLAVNKIKKLQTVLKVKRQTYLKNPDRFFPEKQSGQPFKLKH